MGVSCHPERGEDRGDGTRGPIARLSGVDVGVAALVERDAPSTVGILALLDVDAVEQLTRCPRARTPAEAHTAAMASSRVIDNQPAQGTGRCAEVIGEVEAVGSPSVRPMLRHPIEQRSRGS